MGTSKPSGAPLLSHYLNLARFVAAMAVVLGHARLHVFGDRAEETGAIPALARLVWHLGDFAHVAVIIFFVISGYLVGGKLYYAGKPGFSAKYLLDRATRIYTVAIPALVFGFALMLVQQQLYGHAFKLRAGFCEGTAGQLAGSLIFLHRGIMETPCFDSPYWSLTYEVFYYLFFFSIAIAVTGQSTRGRAVAVGAAILLGLYGLLEPRQLYAYSTIWLLGMAAAHPHPFRGRQLLFTGGIVSLLFIQTALRFDDGEAKWELFASLLMVGSIVLLRRWQPFNLSERTARLAAFGAAMSYSLYLAHAPAMNLVRGILEGSFVQRLATPISHGTPLYWYPLFITVGALSGFACWAVFERRTIAIRFALERRIGVTRPLGHQPIPANKTVDGRPPLPSETATQLPAESAS